MGAAVYKFLTSIKWSTVQYILSNGTRLQFLCISKIRTATHIFHRYSQFQKASGCLLQLITTNSPSRSNQHSQIIFKYKMKIDAATGGVLCKKIFSEISQNSQENTCLSKTHTALLKKRLWHRYFPVSFTKFLRTPFLQNTSGRLFLENSGSYSETLEVYSRLC